MAASGGVKADIGRDQNLVIGEDRTINIDVNQADGSTAQSMTGWALSWFLMDKPEGTALATLTTASEITIGNGDGTDDRAAITVADTVTEALTDSSALYWHELWRTDAGSESRIAYGTVHILKGVV